MQSFLLMFQRARDLKVRRVAGFWSVDELLDRSSTGQCFALQRGRHLADHSPDGSGSRANGKLTS